MVTEIQLVQNVELCKGPRPLLSEVLGSTANIFLKKVAHFEIEQVVNES